MPFGNAYPTSANMVIFEREIIVETVAVLAREKISLLAGTTR